MRAFSISIIFLVSLNGYSQSYVNDYSSIQNFGELELSENNINLSAIPSINLDNASLNVTNLNNVNEQLSEASNSVNRGANEVRLYNRVAPSVVLIFTESGSSGSGSVITDRHILTNWHVVNGNRNVNVVFKPSNNADDPFLSDSVIGDVLYVDQIADLAIVQLRRNIPTSISPIPLAATSNVPVGSDTFAIGHPLGYYWTLTRGIVTRSLSEEIWQYQYGFQHTANVVQTQTPISPGNSGGPLLNNEGEIIGVNSFGNEQGQAMNFSVSVEDVRNFISSQNNRFAVSIPSTEASFDRNANCEIDEGDTVLSDDRLYDLTPIYSSCMRDVWALHGSPRTRDGFTFLYIDSNFNSNFDIQLIDIDNDGAWDLSMYDVDDSGDYDLVGYHDENDNITGYDSYARFQRSLSTS